MAAFNAVRLKVKPERDQDFLNAHDKSGQRGRVYSTPISSRRAIALIASSLSGKT